MRRVIVLATCALLAACQTTSAPQMRYVRTDGKAVEPGSPLLEQFGTDRTICLGEMSKANMAGSVAPSGNVFIDVDHDVQRNQQADAVMAGCMAQHGWKLVPAQTTLATQ